MTLFMGGRVTGVVIAFTLVVVAISGLQAGAEADSRAEIERELGEPPSIDWDEQEDPRLKYVPDRYVDTLEVDILPESNWYEAQYRGFAEWLLAFMFAVAEGAALFGYTHAWFFGNSAVQAGLQLSVYLALFAVVGVQLVRVRALYRGVDG